MKSIKSFSKHSESGFTLLEILLVVAAISILAGIVIFAINPAKQLGDTRNAQRRVDVNTILNAVYQYSIDHNGQLPDDITLSSLYICQVGASSCSGMVDLSVLVENEKYLTSIPIDPSGSAPEDSTGYKIEKTSNNRIIVIAPFADNDVGDISTSR